MRSKLLLLWIIGLSLLGFLSSDMYLPAFTSIAKTFNSSNTLVGWTMSIYLLGIASSQLIYGPLADRFGRQPPLRTGLFIFVLATLGVAVSNTIQGMLLMRFLQAIGVCAAMVLWQAIVCDLCIVASERQRIFSLVMPLVGLSPALAPIIGGELQNYFGWRSIFFFIAVIGCLLLFKAFFIKETLLAHKKCKKKQGKNLLLNYKKLLYTTNFTGNALIYSFASGAFFIYLTISPFIMRDLNYTDRQIALSFIPQTLSFMASGYTGKYFINYLSSQRILFLFLALWLLTSFIMILITLSDIHSIIPLLSLFTVLSFFNGAIYPIVVEKALSTRLDMSGTASSLLGFLQMLCCSSGSAIASVLQAKNAPLSMCLLIFLMGIAMLISYKWSIKATL